MTMVFYGIASYHRLECKTYKTLLNNGIPNERILISVNCKEDYEQYSRLYGESVRIIYKEKNNVAGNRNNLLDAMSGDIVILDDDITSFKRYSKNHGKHGNFVNIKIGELDKIMEQCFSKARSIDCSVFGFASSKNQLIAEKHYIKNATYSINGNFQGGFCGYINTNLRHDEKYDVLDDYELNIRILATGGNILRRNDVYAEKGKMAQNKGGCMELYRQGAQSRCMRQLERQWGFMFKTKKQDKGIMLNCVKVIGIK